jgi:transposase
LEVENIRPKNKEEALLAILNNLESGGSSGEVDSAINIAKALVNEKWELKNKKERWINEKQGLIRKKEELESQRKSLITEKEEWEEEKKKLIEENNRLKEELKILRAKQYGKSSEKIKKRIDELEQKIEENEIELELKLNKKSKSPEEEKELNKAKRQRLPEDLEREEVILEAPSRCPGCGGQEFRKISDDISETLEYVPAKYKAIKYVRPRCACKNCETIVQAEAATKGIEKGKAGFGLLANILIKKYDDHLPLYRQSEILERIGIGISRSTMAGWVAGCAKLLEPVAEEIKKVVFGGSEIHGDDIPIKVLEPGLGKTKIGRIWNYVLDGRPHGSKVPPAVCYFYSPDRKGERPASHLENFKGTLHADAYAGYKHLYKSEKYPDNKIDEAACWAHTRRKFYEITLVNPDATIANQTLNQIGKIYKIEEEIRGVNPEERKERRMKESKELVEELFVSFKKVLSKLAQKGSTALAIKYALNNEVGLKRFLTDGKIEIDNNAAERALRAIALGRKNWLFAGSDNGGKAAANIYTVIETAKMNGLNPEAYLKKVLSVILDYNSQKVPDLLPWNIMPDTS